MESNEPNYSLVVALPYSGQAINTFLQKERQELSSIYGKCDKEIDVTPLYINNANKIYSDVLEYRFCVYVFGASKKLVIITRFYNVVIPFDKIIGYRTVNENTVDININNLSNPNIQLDFYDKSQASILVGILNVIKSSKNDNSTDEVEVNRFNLDEELEKIAPNGGVSLTEMNNGCSLTLFIIIASTLACGIAFL